MEGFYALGCRKEGLRVTDLDSLHNVPLLGKERSGGCDSLEVVFQIIRNRTASPLIGLADRVVEDSPSPACSLQLSFSLTHSNPTVHC